MTVETTPARRTPSWLHAVTFGVLAVAAIVIAFPALLLEVGFRPQAIPAFASVLAFNAFAIAVSASAFQLKFRERLWPRACLGFAILLAMLIVFLDARLLWKLVELGRWDRWPIIAILLPGAALCLVLPRLMRGEPTRFDRESVMKAAFSEPEGNAPAKADQLRVVRDLLGLLFSLAAVALVGINILFWAGGAGFGVFEYLTRLSFEYGRFETSFADFVLRASQGLIDAYIENAGRLIVRTVGVPLVITLVIGGISAVGFWLYDLIANRLRFKPRPLTDDEVEAVRIATDRTLAWLESRRRYWWDSAVFLIVFFAGLFFFMALGPVVVWLAGKLIQTTLGLEPLDNIASLIVATVVSFTGGIVLTTASIQLVPGLRAGHISMTRLRLERMPDTVLEETVSALASAVRKGWFPIDRSFDPAAFQHRWALRGRNAALTFLKWGIVAVAAIFLAETGWQLVF